MASTSKAFKIVCGSVSSLFDTRWHTQSLHLLFGQGARTRCPRGENLRALWAFSMKKLRSRLSFFSRKEGQPSASRDSGPTTAGALRRIKSWGSQLDMADELERDRPFSRASAENESELLDCDNAIFIPSVMMRSLYSCWVIPRKSRRCLRVRKLRLNPLNPPALHMTSYWRLWTIT